MEYWGVTENFFRPEGGEVVTPWLATAWQVAPDLSRATVTLRSGVRWHKGYGELTAEDVAWSINDANAATNPTSIHTQAGDLAPLCGEVVVLDQRTVEIPFVAYDVRWEKLYFNQQANGFSIFSKKVFDEKGADWMNANPIGTGPFQVREWTRNDRAVLEAVPNHWDKSPEIEVLRFLEVPEVASRIAFLETGEADVADIPLRDFPDLLEEGFLPKDVGHIRSVPMNFPGNLWETEHALTGEPVEIGQVYAKGVFPWTARHDNAEEMERARKVRWGLAMAIDREAIAEALYAGMAYPNYIGFFNARDPYWDDKWKVPYDFAKANEFLDDANYPKDEKGIRWSMPVFGATNNELWLETADVVSGFWQKLGIDITILHYDYSVFRPSLVARSNTIPMAQSIRANEGLPWDWPRAAEACTLTRGGFGAGWESPLIAEIFLKVAKEPDESKRIEMNNQLADYMYEWMLQAGVVSIPMPVLINPQAIASWDMRTGFENIMNSFELLVPAR